jgi:hypothetical protein
MAKQTKLLKPMTECRTFAAGENVFFRNQILENPQLCTSILI